MLGEGIVSFGVAVVTHDCRKAKWSAKIGSFRVTRLETRIAAGLSHDQPAPYYRTLNRQFVREML